MATPFLIHTSIVEKSSNIEHLPANDDLEVFVYYLNSNPSFFRSEIQSFREKQMQVSRDLEEKQVTCQQLQSRTDELETEIDKMTEDRQRVRRFCLHRIIIFINTYEL